jgi:hypothetical protein
VRKLRAENEGLGACAYYPYIRRARTRPRACSVLPALPGHGRDGHVYDRTVLPLSNPLTAVHAAAPFRSKIDPDGPLAQLVWNAPDAVAPHILARIDEATRETDDEFVHWDGTKFIQMPW